jgi:Na+-translocating ferredoxin:NAD+ oxidoreductase RnfD subunit
MVCGVVARYTEELSVNSASLFHYNSGVSVVVVFINGEMTTTTTTWNGEIIFWGAAGFAGENLR